MTEEEFEQQFSINEFQFDILSSNQYSTSEINVELKKQELELKKIELIALRQKNKIIKLSQQQKKLDVLFNFFINLKAIELIKKQDYINSKVLMEEYIQEKHIQNKNLDILISEKTINQFAKKKKKAWSLRKIFPFSNQ